MKNISHSLLLFTGCLFAICTALAGPEPFPPVKPNPVPEFSYPAVGGSLDEEWLFVDTLFDASTARPDLFSAFPVELEFTNYGRGYLGMLHTVFRTTDAGQSWINMDFLPPPSNNAGWNVLRSPSFISDLAVRPTTNTSVNSDSIMLSVVNGDEEEGDLRLIRGVSGTPALWPDELFSQDRWLTHSVAPTNRTIAAFAGLDGKIFLYDSVLALTIDSVEIDSFLIGDSLHFDTTMIWYDTSHVLRWDTLDYNFFGTWVDDIEIVGERIIAAGSHFITSEDSGHTWQADPAPDPDGVRDLDFAPDGLHGLACGESSVPPGGFVRWTDDGGQSWSDRRLTLPRPIHAVLMLTESIGFAAGGDVDAASGFIYRTDDGGESWVQVLATPAEMRVLNSVRQNGTTVNVIAAGVFPDFAGGVWRLPLQLTAAAGPILSVSPDTLRFGDVLPGNIGTLELTLTNIGDEALLLTNLFSGNAVFTTDWSASISLLPDSSVSVNAFFAPDSVDEYSGELRVQNTGNQDIRVPMFGTSGLSPVDGEGAALPQAIALSIWPNPGNAVFRIGYELSHAQNISLRVFDITGRLVAELERGNRVAGSHLTQWEGARYASGLYFVRLETKSGTRLTKKLMLLK